MCSLKSCEIRRKELKATRSHVAGAHGIKVKYFNQWLLLFMCLEFIFKLFAYITEEVFTVFFHVFQKS